MDFSHPVVQSVFLPMGASFGLALLLSKVSDIRVTDAAIGIALILAILAIAGAPVWPPLSGVQKSFWLIFCAVMLGAVIDAAHLSRLVRYGLMTLLALLSTAWFSWPIWQQRSLNGKADSEFVVLGLALLAGLLVMRLLLRSRGAGASHITMLIVASVAVAGASFSAGSLLLAQMSIALASACAGFALLVWPGARLVLGVGGSFAAGFACFVLVILTLLLTDIPPLALLPILAVFALGWLVGKMPLPAGWSHVMVQPLVIAGLGACLAALAFMLASPSATQGGLPDDDPYYTPSSQSAASVASASLEPVKCPARSCLVRI